MKKRTLCEIILFGISRRLNSGTLMIIKQELLYCMDFFNPEDASRAILSRSFLKSRGSLREKGTGSQFFQDNKIRSCSYVKETPGGLKAVAFYDTRKSDLYPTQSTMRRSWTSSVHSNKVTEHAGGGLNKTLGAYHPNSARNMLKTPEYHPPYPNSSHIQIGTRSRKDSKHYTTTYRNDMLFQKKQITTNNPAIQAFKNKWLRSRLAL